MRCQFCGSKGKCYEGCECSKCLDPEGYDDFKNSDEYDDWIEHEKEIEVDVEEERAEIEELFGG